MQNAERKYYRQVDSNQYYQVISIGTHIIVNALVRHVRVEIMNGAAIIELTEAETIINGSGSNSKFETRVDFICDFYAHRRRFVWGMIVHISMSCI